MGIIATAILGLIIGFLARGLLPGEQKMGLIMTCLLGVAGSLVAGYSGQVLGWYRVGEPAGWLASLIGAIVLLVLVQKLRGSSSS